MLPQFLGLGALRAGSTLLHHWLDEHPETAVPQHRKEIGFFDQRWDRGVDWYARQLPDVGVVGEVSPNYLYDPHCAERIAEVLPDVRLFVVLRNPVERAISQYRLHVMQTAYTGTFAAFLDEHPNAVDRGCYHRQLQHYLDHFPREQLCILVFEDLVTRPAEAARTLFGHLGVDATFAPTSRSANASHRMRHPRLFALGRRAARWLHRHELSQVVQVARRTRVRRFFVDGPPTPVEPAGDWTTVRADVSQLETLLGRTLDWTLPG